MGHVENRTRPASTSKLTFHVMAGIAVVGVAVRLSLCAQRRDQPVRPGAFVCDNTILKMWSLGQLVVGISL